MNIDGLKIYIFKIFFLKGKNELIFIILLWGEWDSLRKIKN